MPTDIVLQQPDAEYYQPQLQALLAEGEEYVITSAAEEARVSSYVVRVKILRKELKGMFAKPIAEANGVVKTLRALWKDRFDNPLALREQRASDGILTYRREQQRQIQEEAMRLRREQEAELIRERERAREAQVEAAAKLADAGYQEASDATLAANIDPPPAPAPIVAQPQTKLRGIHERTTFKARLVNLGEVERCFLMFDQKKADAFARQQKREMECPGFVCESVTTIAGNG